MAQNGKFNTMFNPRIYDAMQGRGYGETVEITV
jgi:hypothetical protein